MAGMVFGHLHDYSIEKRDQTQVSLVLSLDANQPPAVAVTRFVDYGEVFRRAAVPMTMRDVRLQPDRGSWDR